MRVRSVVVVSAAMAFGVGVVPASSAAGERQTTPRQERVTSAHAAASIPQYLQNIARRWMRKPPTKIVKKVAVNRIKSAGKKWFKSGGTECQFPFPEKFCVQRSVWGLGQALWWAGPPGVWNRTVSPRYEISRPLLANEVYDLTCWTTGDRGNGPYGSTNLWYRVTNGGYVSDALL